MTCAPKPTWRFLLPLAGALLAIAAAAPSASAQSGQPAVQPLCCGVPPGDEARADHMIGQWRVTEAQSGMPMREGERVTFRRDGTMAGSSGTCRYTMLRGELTVTCPSGTRQGTLEFLDDDKAVWRIDGEAAVTIELLGD